MMTPIQTSRSVHGAEPLLLADLKTALGITASDHDAYLTTLLTAAREFCEVEGNVGLARQTVTALLPELCNWYQLPFSPIVSITSVKSYSIGVLQDTLVYGENYYIKGDRIVFILPVQAYQVEVVYEAGYYTGAVGTTTTTSPAVAPEYAVAVEACPKSALVAIMQLATDYYDNPGSIGTATRSIKKAIKPFSRRDWL